MSKKIVIIKGGKKKAKAPAVNEPDWDKVKQGLISIRDAEMSKRDAMDKIVEYIDYATKQIMEHNEDADAQDKVAGTFATLLHKTLKGFDKKITREWAETKVKEVLLGELEFDHWLAENEDKEEDDENWYGDEDFDCPKPKWNMNEKYYFPDFVSEITKRNMQEPFPSAKEARKWMMERAAKVVCIVNTVDRKVICKQDSVYSVEPGVRAFSTFRHDYNKKGVFYMQGEGKKVMLSIPEFLESARQLERSGYRSVPYSVDMSCTDPLENTDVLNVYPGRAAKNLHEYDEKIIEPILQHIKEVICSDNEELYNYFLDWLGFVVQRPGKKTGVAILLFSDQGGAGKTILEEFIMKMFGTKLSIAVEGLNRVVSKFNKHMRGKEFVCVNELVSAEKNFRETFDLLKALLTDEFLSCEAKGVDMQTEPNYVNIMCTTNNMSSIAMTHAMSRRMCCIKVSEHRVGDSAYFQKLGRALTSTAADHFYTFLLYRGSVLRMSGAMRPPPMTDLKSAMINISESFHPEKTFVDSLLKSIVAAEEEYEITDIDKGLAIICQELPAAHEKHETHYGVLVPYLVDLLEERSRNEKGFIPRKNKLEPTIEGDLTMRGKAHGIELYKTGRFPCGDPSRKLNPSGRVIYFPKTAGIRLAKQSMKGKDKSAFNPKKQRKEREAPEASSN